MSGWIHYNIDNRRISGKRKDKALKDGEIVFSLICCDDIREGLAIECVNASQIIYILMTAVLKRNEEVKLDQSQNPGFSGINIIIKGHDVVNIIKTAKLLQGFFKTTNQYEISDILSCSLINGKCSEIAPHNRVEMNSAWMDENGLYDNEIIFIFNPDNLAICEGCVKANEEVEKNSFILAPLIKKRMNVDSASNSQLCVLKQNNILNTKVLTQLVDDIKSGAITLPASAYYKINQKYPYYQINHLQTGAIYTVSTKNIKCDKDLPEGAIRLNYYQRQLLNLYRPSIIDHRELPKILNSKELSKAEIKTLKKAYHLGRQYIPENYAESKDVYHILKKAGYERLYITPVYERICPKKRKTDPILKRLIGESNLVLKCARPYATDEDKQVVRLSSDNMSLLGIEDTDMVNVFYKNKTIKAKALHYDSIEHVKETNIVSGCAEIDTIIGIPAHLRKKLGMNNINITVKVGRDTSYLFRKNTNKQFLPVLAVLFTLIQIFINRILFAFILFLLLLPFVIFIVFSNERNKVK